jgi:diacylglycerol kinase (ATP)
MSKKGKKICAKLIANPGSGKASDRMALLEQVTRCLQDLGIEVDVAVAKPKEEAIPIARRAVKDGYKVIIGMGGDDTIEAIIRGMAGSKTRLGIIPVGTANNLAKGFGIPEDHEAACKLIAEGHVRKLDVGTVKVGKRKKLTFFELVTVGIGAAIYPSAIDARKGKLSSLKDAVVTALAHEARPKIEVTLDGESRVRVRSMLMIASNVPMVGPNMLLDPEASSEDGLLDISLYPDFSKAELLAYFGKLMNETRPNDEGTGIQRYRASKLKVKTSPKLEVMADGVMLGKGTVKIKLHTGALRVIAPEAGAGVEPPPKEAGEDLPTPVAPALSGNNGKAETAAVQ